jgi:histidinol-phosphate aminotransferase
MSKFWSKTVKELTPYKPGEQIQAKNLIKLNTNESPYGPSPKALEAIRSASDDALRLYPPPNSDLLKTSIAKSYQVQANQVFVGNGSDEVLAHIFLGLFKQSQPILFPDITYTFYPVYCSLYEIAYRQIPLNQDFQIQIDDYLAIPNNGGIIFPNPNAPTGLMTPLAEIRRLLDANTESVVVIDEAYVDFGCESSVQLVNQYPNLIVTHSFSKSRALAGLRVGYAIANADLIEGLERVKNSFNSYPLGRLAQAGATAAVLDTEYLTATIQKIQHTRQQLIADLAGLGFHTLASEANFVFTTHPSKSAELIYSELRKKDILIRYFNLPRINNYLRITVGTDEECAKLIVALKEILL